jgi:hypothetical protein
VHKNKIVQNRKGKRADTVPNDPALCPVGAFPFSRYRLSIVQGVSFSFAGCCLTAPFKEKSTFILPH